MKVLLFHIIGLFGVLLIFVSHQAQSITVSPQKKPCCTEQSSSHTESQASSCSTLSPITTDGEHTHCANNCTEICHCPISQISLFPNLLRSIATPIGSQEAYFAYLENHLSFAGSAIWNPPKKA